MEKVRRTSSHGPRHMGECLTFHDTFAEHSANGFHQPKLALEYGAHYCRL